MQAESGCARGDAKAGSADRARITTARPRCGCGGRAEAGLGHRAPRLRGWICDRGLSESPQLRREVGRLGIGGRVQAGGVAEAAELHRRRAGQEWGAPRRHDNRVRCQRRRRGRPCRRRRSRLCRRRRNRPCRRRRCSRCQRARYRTRRWRDARRRRPAANGSCDRRAWGGRNIRQQGLHLEINHLGRGIQGQWRTQLQGRNHQSHQSDLQQQAPKQAAAPLTAMFRIAGQRAPFQQAEGRRGGFGRIRAV